MIFKDPWILLFIPILAVFFYFVYKKISAPGIRFSSNKLVNRAKPTARLVFSKSMVYLKFVALFLFIIALARPQSVSEETQINTEGIDIVLAVDASGSMLAEDFTLGKIRQNRLEVVKKVVEDFIRKRKSDRIGMVAFAARAYTVCPLTLDYDWLIRNLERIEIGAIEDGTAIGSAIASSLVRLEDTEAKSKIIILLTDGINNAGKMSPPVAAEAAKALGVKIYTIGAGSRGLVPYPMRAPWGGTFYENVKIEIDEELLEKIAADTGGKYFRATDTDSLEKIYTEIDKMEKTTVEEVGFRRFGELFPIFLIPALVLLLVEIILSNSILRRLP